MSDIKIGRTERQIPPQRRAPPITPTQTPPTLTWPVHLALLRQQQLLHPLKYLMIILLIFIFKIKTTMDRRARVNELLGTYHPSNQSSNVPTTNSYSSLRSTSRAGDYLNPGPVAERRLRIGFYVTNIPKLFTWSCRFEPTWSTERRSSAISLGDDSSPSYTPSYRSRSPSRYNPENSNYAQRRARLGLDNNDDSTPSYSATRRARLGLDNDDDTT